MAGMPEGPGFDPQAMRQAADMMASMSPEALEQMTSMAASRHVGLQQQQHPSPQPPSLQTGPGSSQQAVEAMQVCSSVTKGASFPYEGCHNMATSTQFVCVKAALDS